MGPDVRPPVSWTSVPGGAMTLPEVRLSAADDAPMRWWSMAPDRSHSRTFPSGLGAGRRVHAGGPRLAARASEPHRGSGLTAAGIPASASTYAQSVIVVVCGFGVR